MLLCVTVATASSCRSRTTSWGLPHRFTHHSPSSVWSLPRGGASTPTSQEETEELSLDDKVKAAMKKLGLSPPDLEGEDDDENCKDGVCVAPNVSSSTTEPVSSEPPQDPHALAAQIAKDLHVDESLAWAALGATMQEGAETTQRRYDEVAARDMIQQELVFIEKVSEEAQEVKQLVEEGHDLFLVRRALAFAEMNVDDARAILVADQQDAQQEADDENQEPPKMPEVAASEPMKTVSINSDIDPTKPAAAPQPQQQAPKPAKKEDVVFEATASQVQKLVLESPVPVLVDVYADWCGPCKALGPALEDMAVKAGGMFRLVKINADHERAVSGALEVTALPTVFGIRDGKILNMFEGMPRSEDAMKNFMMGLLMPGANFDPPVTAKQEEKFSSLSSKLMKTAGAATFSFSARERLQDKTAKLLDQLVGECNGNMADAQDSAKVVRSLLSNAIRDPFETKFRRVNLENKILAAKVASFPSCLSILKSVGFAKESDASAMVLGKNKKVVNVAPLTVSRDCIDKWIDRNRQKIAAAERKRRDDEERQRLAEEAANASDEEEDEEEEITVDPDAVSIKLRIEGKKKIHDLDMRADNPLSTIIDSLPVDTTEEEEIQITCVAKRLIVKSSDSNAMNKSLREHGLVPAASIVVKIGDGSKTDDSVGGLKERAAAKKSKKKGSHTMQSVGIYSKDDNAKGELIDGGGGVWYEHDVSDDEAQEESADVEEEKDGSDDANKETSSEPEDEEE